MHNLYSEIAVIIMIGGKSSRLGGGIKSLIKINNKKIFDIILERIQPQIDKIIVNSNIEDEEISKYKFPIIKDVKQGYLGPLAGIHAGMQWMSKNKPEVNWLLTLPGDTPFIPLNLVSCFKEKINQDSKIILAKSNDKIHPIIGVWHTSLLTSLNKHLESGTRKILE
ncbi:molybdenum cofactor guanylyltransferase, partial [Alphaproteobacteria bacterium]|nr:molybdenum cofactor guanylyltransferase [Alphaproteobacteria bacterium]